MATRAAPGTVEESEDSVAADDGSSRVGAPLTLSPALSDRQWQILQLVAAGWTNPRIARHLGLSPRKVENHRAHACRRLGLRGNHALMRWALLRAGPRPADPIE